MKYKYCPHCGHKVVAGATFCNYCGHRLPNTNNINNNQNAQPNQTRTNPNYMNQQQPQPQQPMQNNIPPRKNPTRPRPVMHPQQNKHHTGNLIIIALVIIALGFGGYYAYNHVFNGGQSNTSQSADSSDSNSSNSNNSGSNSNSSGSSKGKTSDDTTKSSAQSTLKEVWDETEAQADEGECDNPVGSFMGGQHNRDYKSLMSWANDIHKASSIKNVDINPQVKSISKGPHNTSIVHYEVKYKFENDNGDRYQGFNWTAKMQNNEIYTNKANNKHPVYDHS